MGDGLLFGTAPRVRNVHSVQPVALHHIVQVRGLWHSHSLRAASNASSLKLPVRCCLEELREAFAGLGQPAILQVVPQVQQALDDSLERSQHLLRRAHVALSHSLCEVSLHLLDKLLGGVFIEALEVAVIDLSLLRPHGLNKVLAPAFALTPQRLADSATSLCTADTHTGTQRIRAVGFGQPLEVVPAQALCDVRRQARQVVVDDRVAQFVGSSPSSLASGLHSNHGLTGCQNSLKAIDLCVLALSELGVRKVDSHIRQVLVTQVLQILHL